MGREDEIRGGESLVTTDCVGVSALILFITVMMTTYVYFIIIHTLTSHTNNVYKTKLLFFKLMGYPSRVCLLSNLNGSVWKHLS